MPPNVNVNLRIDTWGGRCQRQVVLFTSNRTRLCDCQEHVTSKKKTASLTAAELMTSV